MHTEAGQRRRIEVSAEEAKSTARQTEEGKLGAENKMN